MNDCKLNFSVIAPIPEILDTPLKYGVLGRAVKMGLIGINTFSIREYASSPNNKIDDHIYGGGAGMALMYEPIKKALLDAIRAMESPVIYVLSAGGRKFNHEVAHEMINNRNNILICVRYEGIDERVYEICSMEELSVGDFILSGGELAALSVIDATSRLVPGVLGNEVSLDEESFKDGLLDYPVYTRPEEIDGMKVPEVLLSGDHKKIKIWRDDMRLQRTRKYRPDLLHLIKKT